jgi:hypothetical protein
VSLLGRREFLIGGAGAAVLGAHAVRATSADPELYVPNLHAAYEPWRSWRADGIQSPLTVVHAAILAANAHDTQPWRFQIGSDRIDVYADADRHLGAMDPFRRELHLSLGCALENAVLIARSLGYAADLRTCGGQLREGGIRDEGRHVASISLRQQEADASPLAAAIPHRHTNRSPYQGERSIPIDMLHQLSSLAIGAARLTWITDPAARRDFAAATIAATETIVADSVMIADSDRWFRATDAEIELHRDGPTLYCAGLSPLVLFGARWMPVSTQSAHRHWIDQTRDAQLGSHPVIGMIAVKTLAGFSGDAERQPTFAFRVGWPTRPGVASPRRSLASVVMSPNRADS